MNVTCVCVWAEYPSFTWMLSVWSSHRKHMLVNPSSDWNCFQGSGDHFMVRKTVVVLLNSYSYCLLIILLLPHRLSLVVADGHQPLSPVLPEVFSCSEAVYSHHCCQLFTHGRLTGLCKWIKECCLDPLNLLSMMRWLLLWTGAVGIKIDCLIFLKHKLFE